MKIDIKDSETIFRVLYIVIMIAIVLSAVFLILETSPEEAERISVGCIFAGSVGEDGPSKVKYDCISSVCADAGASLTVRDNVPENADDVAEAVKYLAENKCGVIFFIEPGHARFAASASEKYANIGFFVNDPKYAGDMVSFFGGRKYQERYLAGIIAGYRTKTNVVGYVAPLSNDEVNLCINAFTLGVRSVRLDAQVHVRFTASGYRVSKVNDAVERLAGINADIIAYHSSCTEVPEACEKKGIDFIAYGSDGMEGYNYRIASVGCDRYKLYEYAIRGGTRGKEREMTAFWLGISEDAVDIYDISERVPGEALTAIEAAKQNMISGKDVFSGYIRDMKGLVRCEEDEMISDRMLLTDMFWLAEGVVIDE